MTILENLVQNHPIRKTKAQKQNFRLWVMEEMQKMGCEAKEEKKGSNCNVVAGDPETAAVTFTAHYDTPAMMPFPNFITPKNILVYILYQFALMGGIAVICIVLSLLVGMLVKALGATTDIVPLVSMLAFMVPYCGFLFLIMFGPANKNNVNDNTSGVAAVMEIMQRLPQELRSRAAFILFDNEEKGMLGSSAYASMHKNVRKNKLIINLDCVGDGENILFLANRKTRKLPEYEKLCAAMGAQQGRNLMMEKTESCVYPSDQSNFKYGIAVCALRKMKVIGYYCSRIHTKNDTTCEQINLDFLADGLCSFVSSLE